MDSEGAAIAAPKKSAKRINLVIILSRDGSGYGKF
jgi:hypothetical protein